ncbi:unnamed protein product [Cunninghamella echinulata]
MESIQRITQQTSLASLIALHLGYHYLFTWVLSLSIVLDIFWFILHGGNPQNESGFGFAMIMNIISLIGKPVTVFSAINTIQSRGDTFSAGNFDVPGAFPGAYQTVRDGDNDSFA